MNNRKYRILFVLQSACVLVVILNYYLGATVQDMFFKISTDSVKKDIHDDRPDVDKDNIRVSAARNAKGAPRRAATASNVLGGGKRAPQRAEKVAGPKLSNCTLSDIRPGKMVLTSTNTAFLDITLNMLESMRRAGVCVNTTVVAEDEKAYQYLRWRAEDDPGVNVIKTDSGEMTTRSFSTNTEDVNVLRQKRNMYLLKFLDQGFEVLSCDVDNFFFRDPFPYFQGDFDLAMLDDKQHRPERHLNESIFYDGFAYYKPTERMVKFIRCLIQTVSTQWILNSYIREDHPVHLNVRPLNPNLFPGAALYYYKNGWRKEHTDLVVMHSFGITGRKKKVQLYRQAKLWLVDEGVSKTLPVP